MLRSPFKEHTNAVDVFPSNNKGILVSRPCTKRHSNAVPEFQHDVTLQLPINSAPKLFVPLSKSNSLLPLFFIFSPNNVIVFSNITRLVPKPVHLLLLIARHRPDTLAEPLMPLAIFFYPMFDLALVQPCVLGRSVVSRRGGEWIVFAGFEDGFEFCDGFGEEDGDFLEGVENLFVC